MLLIPEPLDGIDAEAEAPWLPLLILAIALMVLSRCLLNVQRAPVSGAIAMPLTIGSS